MCENFILQNHKEDILGVLENPNKDGFFKIKINYQELFEKEPTLANNLLSDPETALKKWNDAVFMLQGALNKENPNYLLKSNVNCRIYNLPASSQTSLPGNDDVNKFLQVTGTVVRMSARKLLEYQREYVCVKCKYPITVQARYDKRNIIKQPKSCPSPEGCNSKTLLTFGELHNYNCKDYQEIKIQEDLSKLVGTVPNHMIVTLEDDLVNTCKPGENVTITGIVTRRWPEFEKGVKIVVDIVMRANYLEVNGSIAQSFAVSDDMKEFFENFWDRHAEDPLVGRNILLRSIAPEICGLHLIKLALAIVLAGGSQTKESEENTGVDKRAESHLLFIGDPGTGKSQMLRFASKIIPGSVLTTGVGSTGAGLTVTAVQDNGEWQLEAGALVMADGGLCCIDEFNSMKEHDRRSIHEAMEQQTISVAKAGIVCKLKTRCTILASCNPKGNLDPAQPLCMNVAMSSPLLSRFDLILLLRDNVNEENDRNIAKYLLQMDDDAKDDGEIWNLEMLQAYYLVIRKERPKLTKDAETILSTYYQLQKQFGGQNKARTTVRLLESLIRLSQGHAKLMFHQQVEIQDTIFAIALIDTAMDRDASLLNLKLDNNSFSERPEELYRQILETILGKLNLDYIYDREVKKKRASPFKRPSESSPPKQEVKKMPKFLFTRKKLCPEDILTQNVTSCLKAIQMRNQSYSEDGGNCSRDYSSEKMVLNNDEEVTSSNKRHGITRKGEADEVVPRKKPLFLRSILDDEDFDCQTDQGITGFRQSRVSENKKIPKFAEDVASCSKHYSSEYAQKLIADEDIKGDQSEADKSENFIRKSEPLLPKFLIDKEDVNPFNHPSQISQGPTQKQVRRKPRKPVIFDLSRCKAGEEKRIDCDKVGLTSKRDFEKSEHLLPMNQNNILPNTCKNQSKTNTSEDSGNFTNEFSFNSPVPKKSKCNFVKRKAENSKATAEMTNKNATSGDLVIKKSINSSQTTQTKKSKESLAEAFKSFEEVDGDMDLDQYFEEIKSQKSRSKSVLNKPKVSDFPSKLNQPDLKETEEEIGEDRASIKSIASDDLDIENCIEWNLGESEEFDRSTQMGKIKPVENQTFDSEKHHQLTTKGFKTSFNLVSAFQFQPREDKESNKCTTNTKDGKEKTLKNLVNISFTSSTSNPSLNDGLRKSKIDNTSTNKPKPSLPKSALGDKDFDPFDFLSQISATQNSQDQGITGFRQSRVSENKKIPKFAEDVASCSKHYSSEYAQKLIADEDIKDDQSEADKSENFTRKSGPLLPKFLINKEDVNPFNHQSQISQGPTQKQVRRKPGKPVIFDLSRCKAGEEKRIDCDKVGLTSKRDFEKSEHLLPMNQNNILPNTCKNQSKTNTSEDSGNFTNEFSFNSPVPKKSKCNFVKRKAENSKATAEMTNKNATSGDLVIKKSVNSSQTTQTKKSKESLAEAIKSFEEVDGDMDLDQYFDEIKSQKSQSKSVLNKPKVPDFPSKLNQPDLKETEEDIGEDRASIKSIASDDLDIENCIEWNLGEREFDRSTQIGKVKPVENETFDSEKHHQLTTKGFKTFFNLVSAFQFLPSEDKESNKFTTNTKVGKEKTLKNLVNVSFTSSTSNPSLNDGLRKSKIDNTPTNKPKPSLPKSALEDEDFDPFDFPSQISATQNSQASTKTTLKEVNYDKTSSRESVYSEKSGSSQTESKMCKSFFEDEDFDLDENPFLRKSQKTQEDPLQNRNLCDMGQKTQKEFIRGKFTLKKGGKMLPRSDSSNSTN